MMPSIYCFVKPIFSSTYSGCISLSLAYTSNTACIPNILSTASLPNFAKDTMYKGMKKEKKYTLKELELFEEDS